MITMEDRDGFIWMDGEWLDWREAKIHGRIRGRSCL